MNKPSVIVDYKNRKVKHPSLIKPILEGIAFSSVVIMCVVIYFVISS